MNEIITKEVMQQYEKVRSGGACNMVDYYCVINTAYAFKLYDLAELEREDYFFILSNYSELTEKFNIK